MTSNSPNPAWPLRSDAESAGEFRGECINCVDNHKSALQPTRRERAFDAAQRLVLSQPHMAIGQLEQNRLATYILELATRFEAWMAEPWIDLRSAEDRVAAPQYAGFAQSEPVYVDDGLDDLIKASGFPDPAPADIPDEAEALEAADPVIDAYIESDKRVMALTDAMLKEQRSALQRLIIVEGKVESLLRNRNRDRLR